MITVARMVGSRRMEILRRSARQNDQSKTGIVHRAMAGFLRKIGTEGLLKKSVFEMLLMYHGKLLGQAPIFLSHNKAYNTININKLVGSAPSGRTTENYFQSRIFLHPANKQPHRRFFNSLAVPNFF